ncbi:MAG: DMT family transporter [Lachnospiraceae bacterium]|nr:DMT family transporter [Lachnospiraceae bacterium]
MKPKNAFLLFTAAFIWGIAFVAQSSAAEFIRPFTFNGIRCLIGGITLLPLVLILQSRKRHSLPLCESCDKNRLFTAEELRHGIPGGIACGICLCLGSTLQQFGIEQTSVGKAGFITALYIVFVPIVSCLFFRKKIALPVILSVILGLVGLFLLCMTEKLSISRGDFYVLLCSFAFTAHILVIDYFSDKADGVLLSCIQFLTCGLISLPFILFMEHPALSQIWAARLPILYAGALSCGVAYTLQIVGQKNMNPTIASLILSLESVVSVLAGWVLLRQTLSGREIAGCIVMFIAIIIAQLPSRS